MVDVVFHNVLESLANVLFVYECLGKSLGPGLRLRFSCVRAAHAWCWFDRLGLSFGNCEMLSTGFDRGCEDSDGREERKKDD